MSNPITRSSRKRRRSERERRLIQNHIGPCGSCATPNCRDCMEAVILCSDYNFGIPKPDAARWSLE